MLAEFPLWIAMLIRSSRYDEDLGSPVAAISFLPNSLKNVEACIPKTPEISTPTVTKLKSLDNDLYLFCFFTSASEAAALTIIYYSSHGIHLHV